LQKTLVATDMLASMVYEQLHKGRTLKPKALVDEAVVRPARPSDREPLMSFIKDVWSGHDYIPKVWDAWLSDKRGRMFVVEVGGVPVGMNRVRFLEDGSAWFEGARVHPEFRGRGLASMLGENSMKVAGAQGVRVFRLTSGSRNKAAHRQISRMNFSQASRWSVYEPPTTAGPAPYADARIAGGDQLGEVMRLITESREFMLGAGVFWHDFTAAALSRDVVRRLLGRGEVWTAGRAVAVAREGGEGSEIWEQVCFLGGPGPDAMKLVKSVLGRDPKAVEKWVFVPQRSPLIHGLRVMGYERNFSMILFERKAAKG
jgi:GNAT superfamily N-acetyltransferase